MYKTFIKLLAAIILGCATNAAVAAADSGFIAAPAISRSDIAYDTIRHVLYISGGASLQRYDMVNKVFLSPISLGGITRGMDISADGSTLAVANSATTTDGRNYIDLIALSSLAKRRVYFTKDSYESGTFTVAFDKQNFILVSSDFNGSGWVPLRKYNPFAQTSTTIGSIRQRSMLSASADRSVVAIAESNISNGAWGVYKSGDASYSSANSTGWFAFEIAASRNGRQFAVPSYNGTYIYQGSTQVALLGTYAGAQPIGAAYNPKADIAYFPFAQTNIIYKYDTLTGAVLGSYTTPAPFSWTGNWAFGNGRIKVAADGTYLFCTVGEGVYFTSL